MPNRTRILYTFAVVIVTLFVMAFIWFIMYAVVMPTRAAILTNMAQYDTANSTYSSFELADAFVNNLWAFFLVILVFGVLYWVYIYSQRKGEVMVVR